MEERELFSELIRKHRCILMLGATDTGKTTFIHKFINFFFSSEFCKKKKLGVVDADIGQSDIGPPSTVGLAIPEGEIKDYRELNLEALEFLGFFSPPYCIPELLSATSWIVNIAWSKGVDILIIDTTGLVGGPLGIRLKQLKIELIMPDAIIALEREEELTPILQPFLKNTHLTIYRIPPVSGVLEKTPDQRRIKRESELSYYFKEASLLSLPLEKLTAYGYSYYQQNILPLFCGKRLAQEELEKRSKRYQAPILYGEVFTPAFSFKCKELLLSEEVPNFSKISADVIITSPKVLESLLIGLYKDTHELLALGIIEKINFFNSSLYVLTPLKECKKDEVRLIKFSQLKTNILPKVNE
jgi:polynucleotide 5'-hydroxyl-kinase GRC3/NOL9